LKNLLLGKVHLNLLICLKILMMHLINIRFMIYLNFALIITRKKMTIFLNILIDVIRLQRIYNFLCSMLVFTPFA
jgi:hypothetical protein